MATVDLETATATLARAASDNARGSVLTLAMRDTLTALQQTHADLPYLSTLLSTVADILELVALYLAVSEEFTTAGVPPGGRTDIEQLVWDHVPQADASPPPAAVDALLGAVTAPDTPSPGLPADHLQRDLEAALARYRSPTPPEDNP